MILGNLTLLIWNSLSNHITSANTINTFDKNLSLTVAKRQCNCCMGHFWPNV